MRLVDADSINPSDIIVFGDKPMSQKDFENAVKSLIRAQPVIMTNKPEVQETYEPKLIDADKLRSEMENYSLQVETYKRDGEIDRMTKLVQAVQDHAAKCVSDTPIIDPETLPIVRQLREQLERVTAEREAAIRAVTRLIKEDANPCVFCEKSSKDCGANNPDFCSSFRWRGAQKEE